MISDKVFVALPNNGTCAVGLIGAMLKATRVSDRIYDVRSATTSLLAQSFNMLWAAALNERPRFTHFAMVHSDIVPENGWLDLLISELDYHKADILSVVSPIKDARGLTSTGTYNRSTGFVRRFTMHEVCDMRVTFGADDPDHCPLLVNTGCWICDFTKPWVESMYFNITDDIAISGSGVASVMCMPEDWAFSLRAAQLGLKVMATSAVKLTHFGNNGYRNDFPWGTWKHDHGDGQQHQGDAPRLIEPVTKD